MKKLGLRDNMSDNTYNLNNTPYISNPIMENFDVKGYFLEEPINKKSFVEPNFKKNGYESYKFKKTIVPNSTKSNNKKISYFRKEEENSVKNDSFEDFVKGLSCKTIGNAKIIEENKRLNMCFKNKK